MTAGQFFGALLIVGGVLIAALCGLCTVVVIGASVSMPRDPQGYGGGGMIPVALIFGGVPMIFGGLMIWAGVALVRSGRKPAQPPKTFE